MAKSEWRVQVTRFHELSTNTHSKLINLYRLRDAAIDDGHVYTREYYVNENGNKLDTVYFKTEKEYYSKCKAYFIISLQVYD